MIKNLLVVMLGVMAGFTLAVMQLQLYSSIRRVEERVAVHNSQFEDVERAVWDLVLTDDEHYLFIIEAHNVGLDLYKPQLAAMSKENVALNSEKIYFLFRRYIDGYQKARPELENEPRSVVIREWIKELTNE